MAIRFTNTPAPLTVYFGSNLWPWSFAYLLPLGVLFAIRRVNVAVIVFFAIITLVLFLVPFFQGAEIEIAPNEVIWKKTFMGMAWSTHRTAFADIFTIRWMPQRWPWYSRNRIPSYILVKHHGGWEFPFREDDQGSGIPAVAGCDRDELSGLVRDHGECV
jgi:hypothetical protein